MREPWRNGVVEHFNDVWDKSFFRTETFNSIEHLRAESAAFVESHNTHHRYSVHSGATPNQVWADRLRNPLSSTYEPPTGIPAKVRIEIVRFIRSNGRIELFGKRIRSSTTAPSTSPEPFVDGTMSLRNSTSPSGTMS